VLVLDLGSVSLRQLLHFVDQTIYFRFFFLNEKKNICCSSSVGIITVAQSHFLSLAPLAPELGSTPPFCILAGMCPSSFEDQVVVSSKHPNRPQHRVERRDDFYNLIHVRKGGGQMVTQPPAGRGRWPPFLAVVLMEISSCQKGVFSFNHCLVHAQDGGLDPICRFP